MFIWLRGARDLLIYRNARDHIVRSENIDVLCCAVPVTRCRWKEIRYHAVVVLPQAF
jgi:hypothetical protein